MKTRLGFKKFFQKGFTLIEVIAATSVVAVVAATVVPKALGTVPGAQSKAVQAVAGNLQQAASNSNLPNVGAGSISDCSLLQYALDSNTLPAGYNVYNAAAYASEATFSGPQNICAPGTAPTTTADGATANSNGQTYCTCAVCYGNNTTGICQTFNIPVASSAGTVIPHT